MTELEALAKDCIENHTHKLVDKPTKQDIYLREESIFIQGYRQSKKRIDELEKEIAELREKLNFSTQYYRGEEAMRQLTKAKVCLEQLVSEITVGELEVDPNVLQQAEQFLSEVEK